MKRRGFLRMLGIGVSVGVATAVIGKESMSEENLRRFHEQKRTPKPTSRSFEKIMTSNDLVCITSSVTDEGEWMSAKVCLYPRSPKC